MKTERLTQDIDLVQDLFNERDAELIINITPIQVVIGCGIRTLKNQTIFQLRVLINTYNKVRMKGEGEVTDFWKKVWKFRVPPKVKDLLWLANKYRVFDGEKRKDIAMTCWAL